MTRPALSARLEGAARRLMAEHSIPGLAASVVVDGRAAFVGGFGVTHLDRGEPVTPHTLFHLASVTKLFVATAVMQLVERGRVALDDPVARHLRYFPVQDERGAGITFRQLLSHTAGMPDEEDYGWERPEYDEGALERYVRGLKGRSLIAAPGEKFAYSNVGFEVLGDAVSKVGGVSFEEYVRANILAPLGMRRSTLLLVEARTRPMAWPHVLDESGAPRTSSVFPYHRAHAPSSTLYSSASEMARWAIANLNRGELEGARILGASSYDLLWKPHASGDEDALDIGLGWFLRSYRGDSAVGHDGGDTGFTSSLVLVPRRKLAAAVLCNCDWVRPRAIAHALLGAAEV